MVAQPVRRGVGAALAVLLLLSGLLGLSGCGTDPKTERLEKKLEATHLKLYEVDLREARPVSAKVDGDGRVNIRYQRRNGYDGFTLTISPAAYDPKACMRFRASGATCSWRDGVLRSTFEEMSTVWVDRKTERLGIGDLVTEVDPDLIEDAVTALRKAKPVDAETVASY